MFYTYVHYSNKDIPLYVGKGKGRRAYSKRDYGQEYYVKIVDSNLSESQALDLEELLIDQIGLDNLHNKCKRGYFSSAIRVDYKNLQEQINEYSLEDLHKLAEALFADAYSGNVKAIKMVFKLMGSSWQPKINNLLQLNSEQ